MLRTVSPFTSRKANQNNYTLPHRKEQQKKTYLENNNTKDQVHFSGGSDIIIDVPEDLITGTDPMKGLVARIIKKGIKGTIESFKITEPEKKVLKELDIPEDYIHGLRYLEYAKQSSQPNARLRDAMVLFDKAAHGARLDTNKAQAFRMASISARLSGDLFLAKQFNDKAKEALKDARNRQVLAYGPVSDISKIERSEDNNSYVTSDYKTALAQPFILLEMGWNALRGKDSTEDLKTESWLAKSRPFHTSLSDRKEEIDVKHTRLADGEDSDSEWLEGNQSRNGRSSTGKGLRHRYLELANRSSSTALTRTGASRGTDSNYDRYAELERTLVSLANEGRGQVSNVQNRISGLDNRQSELERALTTLVNEGRLRYTELQTGLTTLAETSRSKHIQLDRAIDSVANESRSNHAQLKKELKFLRMQEHENKIALKRLQRTITPPQKLEGPVKGRNALLKFFDDPINRGIRPVAQIGAGTSVYLLGKHLDSSFLTPLLSFVGTQNITTGANRFLNINNSQNYKMALGAAGYIAAPYILPEEYQMLLKLVSVENFTSGLVETVTIPIWPIPLGTGVVGFTGVGLSSLILRKRFGELKRAACLTPIWKGISLFYKAPDRSPHEVARADDAESIKKWIDLGISLDYSTNINPFSPLVEASERGNINVVKALLKTDQISEKYLNKSLEKALACRKQEVAELLINTGKINYHQKDFIEHALKHENYSIAKSLMDRNGYEAKNPHYVSALITGRNRKAYTDLTPQEKKNEDFRRKLAKTLIEEMDITSEANDVKHWDVIATAVKYQDDMVLKELLDTNKMDLNRFDGEGFTPLHQAVKAKRNDILQTLIDTGEVDIELKSSGTITISGPKGFIGTLFKIDSPLRTLRANLSPLELAKAIHNPTAVSTLKSAGAFEDETFDARSAWTEH